MKANSRLAAAAQAVLAERGLTLRAAGELTGLNHVTVRNLRLGVAQRPDTILKFARGLGLDPNEWLELAGHTALAAGMDLESGEPALPAVAPASDTDSENGYGRFVLGLAELYTELGRPIPVSLDLEQARRMTPAQAEETLTTLRRQAEEGLI